MIATAGPVGMTTRAEETAPAITLAFMNATRSVAASKMRRSGHHR